MKQNMCHTQSYSANWQYVYAPNPAMGFGYFVVSKYEKCFIQTSQFQIYQDSCVRNGQSYF